MNINPSPLSVLNCQWSTHTIHIYQQPISQRAPSSFSPHHQWASFISRAPVYVTFSSYCSPSSTTNLLRVPSLDDSRRPPWRWYLFRTPLTMNRNLRQLYFPRVLALGLISRQPPPRRRTSIHNMTMSVANIPRLGTPKHTRTGSSRSNSNKNHTYWATE
jgi:hypothetical protein